MTSAFESQDQRFIGTSRLYGQAAMKRFAASHIMVIGLGGVGSWTVEALARSGAGRLTLVDLDEICVTNINRQLPALDVTVGRLKAEVLRERALAINPGISVAAETVFYTEATATRLLDVTPDLVIDAIDGLFQKAHLIAECRKRSIPIVVSGSCGGRKDPTRMQSSDITRAHHDSLLMLVRKRLRRDFGFPRDTRRKWNIPCVFSEEPVQECPAGADEGGRLNCDGALGSSVTVTASFGMALAAMALDMLQCDASSIPRSHGSVPT